MVRALIFDMDGTLFQTHKILAISLEDTFDYLREIHQWGGETPIEKYEEIMGAPLPVVWETLMPNHTDTVRTLANDYFHKQLIDNIKHGKGDLYPHVFELFDFLKANGFISIGCNFDFAQVDELSHADMIIDHLQELKAVLTNLDSSRIQDNVSLGK